MPGRWNHVIVYHTDRYAALPLTIAGPGAGPDITASGVLVDLVAAARELTRYERTADILQFEAPQASPGGREAAVQRVK